MKKIIGVVVVLMLSMFALNVHPIKANETTSFLPVLIYKTGGAVTSVAVSGNGQYIVAGSEDGYAYLFDRNGNLLWKFNASGEVRSVDISKDGNYIAVGAEDGSYLLTRDEKLLWKVDGSSHVEISDDGRTVLVGRCLYDRGGNELACGGRYPTRMSPEGNYIGSWSYTKKDWYDLVNGEYCKSVFKIYATTNKGAVFWEYSLSDTDNACWAIWCGSPSCAGGDCLSLSISSYAEYIFGSYKWDNKLYLGLLYKNGTQLWNYKPEREVYALDISYDGAYAVAGDVLGNIYAFTRNGELAWRFRASDRISEIKITPDGKYTLAGSWDKHLYLFTTLSGGLLWGGALNGAVTSVDISDNGKTIAAGTDTGYVYIYLPPAEAVQGKITRVEKLIGQYTSMGINMTEAEVILKMAKQLYKEGSYPEASRNADFAYQKAVELKKEYDQAMSRCKNAVEAYQSAANLVASLQQEGVNVSNAVKLLKLAGEQYSLLMEYIKSAQYDKITDELVQKLYKLSTDAKKVAETTEKEYSNATAILNEVKTKKERLESKGVVIPEDIQRMMNSAVTFFKSGEYNETIKTALAVNRSLANLEESYNRALNAYLAISSNYSAALKLVNSLKLENISLVLLENILQQTNRSVTKIEDLFNAGQYDEVSYLANDTLSLINFLSNKTIHLKEQYLKAKLSLENATVLMNSFKSSGVSIPEAENLIKQAQEFFNAGKYDMAYDFSRRGIDAYIKSTERAIKDADSFIKHFCSAGDKIEQAKDYFKNGDYATAYVLAVEAKKSEDSLKKKIYIGLGIIGAVFILLMFLGGEEEESSSMKHESSSGSGSTVQKSVNSVSVTTQSSNGRYSNLPEELTQKYEFLEFLGEGGFGRVFKAKRKKDGKIVAVKVPFTKRGMGKAFLKEIATWSHLNHKNIVKLYDADIEPIPHLEMEYVEGIKIEGELIRDMGGLPKPIPEDIALELVKGIAAGLKHAHAKGIYHLDLKPLNVLLKSDLTPKITDWGLARISARSSFTNVKGYTPLYTAPELIDEKKWGAPDHRTDLYQLGLILYELLTGELPYVAYTPEVLVQKIISPDIKPRLPSEINEKLGKYDVFFERALAKSKERRFQSVDEFIRALNEIESFQRELDATKKELEATKSTMSRTRSKKELRRLRREAVKKTIKIAILSARLNDKVELLKALDDLIIYTTRYHSELKGAISQVRYMKDENIPISPQFVEELKLLFHKIEREFL